MSILDSDQTFSSLGDAVGLDARLVKAVARQGLVRPTLVQSRCLPLAISSGRDLMVRARTGSGKTLAYCLPLLHKILQDKTPRDNKHHVRGVVLVPTRELCNQIFSCIKSLIFYCDQLVTAAVLSGKNRGQDEKEKAELARQEAMLRDRPNVIIATPAGLLTNIRNGTLNLKSSVETLVVDEADLVLSFGYASDIAEIMRSLPKICQGFLMSATLTPELNSLKRVVLNSPAVLKLEEEASKASNNRKLLQFYLELPKKDKNLVLYVFLKLGLLQGKGIFFVNSTDAGYRLKLFLEQFHIRSTVLNAELPFRSRLNIQEQFNVGNFDYLIATDESAEVDCDSDDEDGMDKKEKKSDQKDSEYGVSRGLDFRNVSFVVNVDFPPTPRSYTHRIGRTARGNAKGVAFTLIEKGSEEQQRLLREIQEDQPPVRITETRDNALRAAAPGTADGTYSDSEQRENQSQPSQLEFDLSEIEGFRYRVEDVSRAVTRTAVKETRASELRAEILNSDRLNSHFADNPADLQILRHDRMATHVSKVQDHLKHVPKYMLPRGMQVAELNKKRKKRRVQKKGSFGQRRTDNDPLQSFDASSVDLDGVAETGGNENFAAFFDGEGDGREPQQEDTSSHKVYASTIDGTGKSTAGRNAWKEKHGKGKFSGKKRKRGSSAKTLGI